MNGERNDLWKVNADQEYHEEIKSLELPYASEVVDEAFSRAFMKIDPVAFGLSLGLTCGLLLFLITNYLVLRQDDPILYILWLFANYFPGYQATLAGSVIGLLYGLLLGFILGWGVITLRNLVVRMYISIIRRRAEIKLLETYDFFPDEQARKSIERD